MNLDTYQNKKVLNELLLQTKEYIRMNNVFPPQEIFKEFFDLYIEQDLNKFVDQKLLFLKVSPYLEEFLDSKAMFLNFHELEYLKNQLKYDR